MKLLLHQKYDPTNKLLDILQVRVIGEMSSYIF